MVEVKLLILELVQFINSVYLQYLNCCLFPVCLRFNFSLASEKLILILRDREIPTL